MEIDEQMMKMTIDLPLLGPDYHWEDDLERYLATLTYDELAGIQQVLMLLDEQELIEQRQRITGASRLLQR